MLILLIIIATAICAYYQLSRFIWLACLGVLLGLHTLSAGFLSFYLLIGWLLWIGIGGILSIERFRQWCFRPFFKRLVKQLPKISETEEQILRSGEVGWEGALMSGRLNWQALAALKPLQLTEQEQAFIEGPVAQLCQKVSQWSIDEQGDLEQSVWQFIKSNGFWGLIIPKAYGGKEFSAWAHAQVLLRLYACHPVVGITVAVPNSLGPAELILKYGTSAQKDYYLPRLAKGEEIPCFGLTGPYSGSDAASIPDRGEVCYGTFNEETVLGIRLSWRKRYITLAPIATLIGLAFKLYDPEHLLGSEASLGITVALIPSHLPGIKKGARHYPLHTPFQNGPIEGEEVFIPLDYIIGGSAMIGRGWQMLMECLGVGRAISIPASGVAAAHVAVAATSAYARVREQFNRPIGDFVGIQMLLAHMATEAYVIDSAHRLALATIDSGIHATIASAIVKYHCTERARGIVTHAMDIHGGKALCLGPNNYLANLYTSMPIGVTVEGANILTRNLIIFGQGLIRCHPYLLNLLDHMKANNQAAVSSLLLSYIGHSVGNIVSMFVLGLAGKFLFKKRLGSTLGDQWQLRHRSAALAVLTDVMLACYGGRLKVMENLSARMGDWLAQLYLASAIWYCYRQDGEPVADKHLYRQAMNQLLLEAEETMADLLQEFSWPVRLGLRWLIWPLGRHQQRLPDRYALHIGRQIQENSAMRDRFTAYLGSSVKADHVLGQLEAAFAQLVKHPELFKRLNREILSDHVAKFQLKPDVLAKHFTENEQKIITETIDLIRQIIGVNSFEADLKQLIEY